MEKIEEAKEFCKGMIKSHPNLKDDIIDLYLLFLDEIDDGSLDHEYELLIGSVKELVTKGV